MRPPFPGMDPWLEHPDLWPDVHNSLITAIRGRAHAAGPSRATSCDVESRTTVLTGLDVDQLYRPDVAIRADGPRAASSRGSGVAVLERAEVKPYRRGRVPIEEDEIEETFLTIQELPEPQARDGDRGLSPTNKKTKDARAGVPGKATRPDSVQV